ncbi:MAG: thioesterase family protein [Actinobacteria bacterium]|nr:thioesterase family protein [Actinomycetota bacterium]NIS33433.1 thioesterase family protein [Actinomycetota bacterium]NIT96886.1 thioesterase family protein [Actinomycetota bacterium]NIU20560.1 thioesterase family protein [Actinomycetota bacterium]NIU68325.1 thioesterase family protein [Actinomycetota bacterium]
MSPAEIDARDWLGLQPTHNPMRWCLPITPAISVRSRFLFGGAALGAATAALEATTERPVVWATAQYLSFAPVGSVMDLDVHVSVASHRTTQARVIGHVGEDEIITVTAALGRRDLELEETWPRMPAVLPPDECRPRKHHYDRESLGQYLEQRMADAPADVHAGGPTGHGEGRVCVWAQPPAGVSSSAATLAVLGDWVPMGIGLASGQSLSSNSLDNTLRILSVRPCEWYLLEIEAAGIRHGFGHGQLRIWSDDGHLQAIASQSVVVRERKG